MFINQKKYRIFPILFFVIILFCLSSLIVLADDTVIGQATAGESGSLSNNKAGDQSGREAALSSWGYGSGAYKWKYVFRAKNPETAKILAETMKKACANNHIGYDLKDRGTCYDEAKKVNWKIEKIDKDCETSCVDLVSVCLNTAGIEMPREWASVSVYNDLMPTGLFNCYTSSDYISSPQKLLPGDILCNPYGPHTAMVVESPNKLLFNVKYVDTNGKTKKVKIEDGNKIDLNFNNGKNNTEIKIESNLNLKKFTPERSYSKFKGWNLNNNSFTAVYQSQTLPIFVKNQRKKIGK